MAYPTNNPEWATSNTYVDGTTANKIRPDEGLRQYGYNPISTPTAQELNWQFNNLYLQILELKTQLATPSQTPINELKLIVGDNRNPNLIYGYGTWSPYAQGRTLIGAGTGTDDNGKQISFAGDSKGGNYEKALTQAEMPAHAHAIKLQYQGNNKASEGSAYAANSEIQQGDIGGTDTRTTETSGSGQAFSTLSPYDVIYIWKRIS